MNPFLALVLVAAADPTAGAVDQVWADKARAAVPHLIDRRLQLSPHLDEVNQCVVTPQPGGTAETTMPMRAGTTVNEISQHGNQLFVKSVKKSDDSNCDEILILCRNEYYNFKLTKKDTDGRYVLVSHSNDPPKGDWQAGRCAHLLMISPMQSFLKALESRDQHVLRHLSWDAARALVVAEYETRHDDPKRVFEYRCLFDPARGWAPVEVVLNTWAARTGTRFEYGFDLEGLAYPSVVEEQTSYHVTPAPPAHVIRFVIQSLGPTRSIDRDFRLTAFGLPEPADAPPLPRSGLPTYVYLLAGSAICAVFSLVFRHFARHHRRET